MENEIREDTTERQQREAMMRRLTEICKAEKDPNFRGSSENNKKEVRNILKTMAEKNMLTVQTADKTWEPVEKIEGKAPSTGPKTYFMVRMQPQSEPYLISLDITGKLLNATEKPVTKEEFLSRTAGLKAPKKPGFFTSVSNAFGFQGGVDAFQQYQSEKAEFEVGSYYALTKAGMQATKPEVLKAIEKAEQQALEREQEQELEDLAKSLTERGNKQESAQENNGPQQEKANDAPADTEEPIVFEPQSAVNDGNAQPLNEDDLFAEEPQTGENNLFEEEEKLNVDDLFASEPSQASEKKEENPVQNGPQKAEAVTANSQKAGETIVKNGPQKTETIEASTVSAGPQKSETIVKNGPQKTETIEASTVTAGPQKSENIVKNGPQKTENIEASTVTAGPQKAEAIIKSFQQQPETIIKAGPQKTENLEKPMAADALKHLTGKALIRESVAILSKTDFDDYQEEHQQAMEILAEKGYLHTMDAKQNLVPAKADAVGQQTFVIKAPSERTGCVCFKAPQDEATGKSGYCCTQFLKQSEFQKINAVNGNAPLNKGGIAACLQVMQTPKTDAKMKDVALQRLKEAGCIQTLKGRTLGKEEPVGSDMPYMVKLEGKAGGYLFSRVGAVNCMANPMSSRLYKKAVASVVAKPVRPNAFFRFVNGVSKAFGGNGLKRCRDYERAKMLYKRKLYNAQIRAGYKVNKPRDVEAWERRMLAAAYLAAYDKIRVPNTAHPFFRKLENSKKFKKFSKSPAAKVFLARAHRMTEQKGGVDMGHFIRKEADLLADVKNEMDGQEPEKDWTKTEPVKAEPTKTEPINTNQTKIEPEKEQKKPMTAEERRAAAKAQRAKTKENEIGKTMEKLNFVLPEEKDKAFVDRMEEMMKTADGTRMASILRDLTPESMIRLRDSWKTDPQAAENSVKMMDHPEKILMNSLPKTLPQNVVSYSIRE